MTTSSFSVPIYVLITLLCGNSASNSATHTTVLFCVMHNERWLYKTSTYIPTNYYRC